MYFGIHFAASVRAAILYNEFETCNLKNAATLPSGQWIKEARIWASAGLFVTDGCVS